MPLEITVAICTYNGEKRLPDVLEALKSQINPQEIAWEVIVVDNNSSDRTANLIKNYQRDWPKSIPFSYYFEAKQGAGYARKRAFQAAKADLVAFLDDDNIPAKNWVVACYEFAQKYPQAGAFGSRIYGDFEVTPPESLKKILPFLALTDRGDLPLIYERKKKVLPPSAGLVVRKSAWRESVPPQQILTGRVAGNMLTSEDLEMLGYIQKAGWEIWYNPVMEIQHKIPAWRLESAYLIPFFRGIGLSRHVTRMLSVASWQQPVAFVGYFVNDLRKVIVHWLKYRDRLSTDLVAACEMELYRSSLISPFYLWKHGYLSRK